MLVHCYNPDCKAQEDCRKPAYTFNGELSSANIRSGKAKVGCLACSSEFVDAAQGLCYACMEQCVELPHKIGVIRVKCLECGQSKCRELKDFVVNEEEEECSICCDDIDEGGVMAAFTPCGHACCPECFLRDIATKIQGKLLTERGETGEYTTGCLDPSCPSLLQSNQCISLLPQRVRDMFVRFATEAVVVGELHGEICPFPDCNDAIIEIPDEVSAAVVTCLSCERRFCRCCKGESLTGQCPKVENAEEAKMLAESGITPCPNCNVPIFRSKGCNRIFCTSCKKNFCWICLELTGNEGKAHLQKYAHWMDITRRNKCPLWGGNRLAAEEIEARKAAKAAKAARKQQKGQPGGGKKGGKQKAR